MLRFEGHGLRGGGYLFGGGRDAGFSLLFGVGYFQFFHFPVHYFRHELQ